MVDESLQRWRRASELYDQVRDLDPADRAAHLAAACGADLELIRLVEDLVEEARTGELPTGSPVSEARSDAPTVPDTTLHASDEIGPYRLLERIGEGGMGEVWRAEQQRPIRRNVALKVIKAGLDTKRVVARFEVERQVLALMDHPAIAKVYEAGETPRGLPYFAMEYVAGDPVTDYCDRHRLGTKERLDLFARICEGVQHAHEKGVIHRDLKPSNVLVTLQGGQPVPKIIDFGVAKATAQRLTEKTLFTELGVMIGTPSYMSPEQADLTGLNVDTRTDVYALGVMLYELLTGVLPFDAKTLREAGYEEIRRRIREVDPPKPSTRAGKLGEESAEIARRRGTVPAKLASRLQGDLDWIVMKCLEKDRGRRYASPNELAADLRRHLADEPVAAGPPGAPYRMRKFVRRHRIGVAVSAAAVVALATFAINTAAQNRRIAAERDRADREAEVSRRVTEFMTGLFEMSDPSEARGNTITAREILDRGVERIQNELENEPEVKARLLLSMGEVYYGLIQFKQAGPLLQEAAELARAALGPDHPTTLRAQSLLGQTYRLSRKQEARQLLEATAEQQRRVLGAEHPETLETLSALALLLDWADEPDRALEIHKQVLEARRRTLGEKDPRTIDAIWEMGQHYLRNGTWAQAEPFFREAVDADRAVRGDDHPMTIQAMDDLAWVLTALGRLDEAEETYRSVLAQRIRVFGPTHSATATTMVHLSHCLAEQGRFEESEELYQKGIEMRSRIDGLKNANALSLMTLHATDLMTMRRFGEAEQLLTRVFDVAQVVDEPRGYQTHMCAYNLACVEMVLGRRQKALDWLRVAVNRGFTDIDWIRGDPDLAALAGDPEFERILALADSVR